MPIIAKSSKAFLSISLSTTASRVEHFAGRELVRYLHRMSGAEFSVREEPSAVPPYIRFETRPADAQNDGFKIRSSDEGITICGNNPRSVLYGVYAFLEHLGCVFAEPGVEAVPFSEHLECPGFEFEHAASFKIRSVFRIQKIHFGKQGHYNGFGEHHLPQIDWMAKKKLNHYVFYVDYDRFDLWEKNKKTILEALLDRGFIIELSQHSLGYFFPSGEAEDYGGFGPETYASGHPEWYVGHKKIRIGIPRIQEIIFSRFMDFVRRNRELDVISLWPADAEMSPPENPSLNISDEYLLFWNRAARMLAGEFPEKKLSCLAYFELLEPPLRIHGESNLNLWFCPVFAHSMYPMKDDRNRKYLSMLKGWCEKISPESVAVFGYYGWYPLLAPLAKRIKADWTAYRGIGIGGIHTWCGFTYNLMGTGFRRAPEMNVAAELLWDDRRMPDEIMKKWAKTVFGAASDAVLEVYAIIDAYRETEMQHGLGGGREQETWIALPVIRKCLQVIDHAIAENASEEIARRLELLEELVCHSAAAEIPRTDPRDDSEAVHPY